MTDADRRAALARAEAYGVDLSLLRERLRLTPTERVEKNLQALALVEALRTASPDVRPPPPAGEPGPSRG